MNINQSPQYQTTWDRAQLFTYTNLGSNPINFGSPGPIGQADIVIDDTAGFQSVWGHGGSLSKLRGVDKICSHVSDDAPADSAASLLISMKVRNTSCFIVDVDVDLK